MFPPAHANHGSAQGGFAAPSRMEMWPARRDPTPAPGSSLMRRSHSSGEIFGPSGSEMKCSCPCDMKVVTHATVEICCWGGGWLGKNKNGRKIGKPLAPNSSSRPGSRSADALLDFGATRPPHPVSNDCRSTTDHDPEDATYDFSIGEPETALRKTRQRRCRLARILRGLARGLAEINFSLRRLDAALASAEHAHALRPGDLLHQHDPLAHLDGKRRQKPGPAFTEHFGAQAKIGSWKEQLKSGEPNP